MAGGAGPVIVMAEPVRVQSAHRHVRGFRHVSHVRNESLRGVSEVVTLKSHKSHVRKPQTCVKRVS